MCFFNENELSLAYLIGPGAPFQKHLLSAMKGLLAGQGFPSAGQP